MSPEILFFGLQGSKTIKTTNDSDKVMEILPLHKHPEYMQQCCELINKEWKRSETARLRSFESSCDTLPTNLVLVQGKSVIGHCKLSVIPSLRDSCYLESVVIEKELRGKGYGKYLMQNVENHCKKCGLKSIYLSTKNKKEFYEKLGYTISKPVSIYGQYVPMMNNVSIKMDLNNDAKQDANAPIPPPLPPDLYTGINCSFKVFMSKNV